MPNNPVTTASLASASVPIRNLAQKILVVAQKHSTGSATVDILQENIGSNGEQNSLFGRVSPCAKIITAMKKSNPVSQVDAIGLADGTTARVVTITVGGPATEAGSFNFIHGSQKNHLDAIAVADADTVSTIATAIRAAVNADLDSPFTASGAVADVILTADVKGLVPNNYPIGISGTVPSGVSFTIVETTPGAVDPDTSATLDVVGERRYQVIVWSPIVVNGSADDVVTFLDARFNVTGVIRDGVVLYGLSDTLSNILTENNLFNSENAIPFCYKKNTIAASYFGPHVAEHPDELNGYLAGIIALRLTEGESIARFLNSSASEDQFGGPALASLPFFNTPMDEIAALAVPSREFTPTEIGQLNDSGGSVIGNNPAETGVITGAIHTTYKTLPSGAPDPTWEFLNYRLTGGGIREYFFNNLISKFGQSRLTEGTLSPGRDMANEDSIREFNVRLYQNLSGPGFVLTQKGEAAIQAFKRDLIVSLDLETGTVTITAVVPIVTQLRTINITIKIAFNTTGA